MRTVLATTLAALVAQAMPAQRPLRHLDTPPRLGIEPAATLSAATGLLTYSAGASWTTALGAIASPGALTSWREAALTNHFLGGGSAANGDGVLQHWTAPSTGGSPTLQSTARFAASDVVGLAYDASAGIVYCLDVASRSLRSARWNASQPLAGLTWLVVADASAIPELNQIAELTLLSRGANASFELWLLPWRRTSAVSEDFQADWWIQVDDRTSPPRFLRMQPMVEVAFSIAEWSLVEGTTTVAADVGIDQTATLELVELPAMQVLGAATCNGQSPLTIPLSAPLVLGRHYHLRAQGSPGATEVVSHECHARIGTPQTTPSGLRLGHVQHTPLAAIRENGFLAFTEVTVAEGSLAADRPVAGWCAVAFRDPITGIDPVTTVQGVPWLNPVGFLSAAGTVDHLLDSGTLVAAPLSVPDNPAVIGLVVLLQFALYEQAFWVTDIQGVVVKPAH